MKRTSFWWRDALLALIALTVGLVGVRIGVSGEYAHFIKPSMQPWLIAAGGVIALVAVWHLASLRRSYGDHDDGHQHGHQGMLQVGALMLIPVLVLCVLPTPNAGPALVARKGRVSGTVPPPIPAEGVVASRLDDYVIRATHYDLKNTVGRTFRVVGYISHPKPGGPMYVSRLKINCCVADALVFQAIVLDAPMELPDDLWVEIEGVAVEPVNGEARIKAVRITPVPVPDKPLLT